MFRVYFVGFFLLVFGSVQAQTRLIPSWEQGDTLRYFLSESQLIDEQRVQLRTYEIEFFILKRDEKRFILEGHLYLKAEPHQGTQWPAFYRQLTLVPFTFYFQPGDAHPFSHPVNAERTRTIIKGLLSQQLTEMALQPIDYADLTGWLEEVDSQSALPKVLIEAFIPLNALFDKYGDETTPTALPIHFIDEVECNDTKVQLYWHLANTGLLLNVDTLKLERILAVDTSNTLNTFLTLNECGKLRGLETPVVFDSYSFVQKENWKVLLNANTIYSYAFDEEIRIQMGDIQNWQRVQKRIISLR